ncbi:hypothetical protein DPMN_074068 [Dreissena polymorpha]|uniref:Uncharacterized protein n=1 Tax=Dreissena polymorpha TaxID=45954 RepID=A0A9D3YHX7_DREPO|nr:hypothetical protein DPMN_074068 [Dreissena polymorpha]
MEQQSRGTYVPERNPLAENFILRNLPYHKEENLNWKVADVIQKELELKDISRVERKESRDGKPGVVVARCARRQKKSKL